MGSVVTKLPLKFIHSFADRHGKRRYYVRRLGFKRVPLSGEPLSEEFMAAYRAAVGGLPAPAPELRRVLPGSVEAAVSGYLGSHSFLRLAVSTQRVRRNILRRFCLAERDGVRCGDLPIILLESRHIDRMIAERATTPFAAEHFLVAIRHLMAWAVKTGLVKRNPARELTAGRPGTAGFQPWGEKQIADFRAKHELGTKPRLAMEILLNTGLRRSDAVRLGRQHMAGGLVSIRTQKTGTLVEVPILPDLQTAIDAMPVSNHLTLLVTEYGSPFTAAGFGGWFHKQCADAKLPRGYASHGLRKAAATRLAEHGATAHELMAWFGWSNIREAETYTKRADRRRLTQTAGMKWLTSK